MRSAQEHFTGRVPRAFNPICRNRGGHKANPEVPENRNSIRNKVRLARVHEKSNRERSPPASGRVHRCLSPTTVSPGAIYGFILTTGTKQLQKRKLRISCTKKGCTRRFGRSALRSAGRAPRRRIQDMPHAPHVERKRRAAHVNGHGRRDQSDRDQSDRRAKSEEHGGFGASAAAHLHRQQPLTFKKHLERTNGKLVTQWTAPRACRRCT